MAAAASAPPPLSPTRPGAADQEGSTMSSPLSDVDDKDDNEEDIEHMQLDYDGEGDETPKRNKGNSHASDSDSVLSDAHSDVHSDANDTEAETERLYDTPRHQRRRDVVVDQFNQGQVFEHSPSKLRRVAKLDEEADHGDEESLRRRRCVRSVRASRARFPTKPVTTKDTSVDADNKRDSQERKRKRSPAADPSDPEQPLRKRTASVHELDPKADKHDDDTPMHDDDADAGNGSSGSPFLTEHAEDSPRKKSAVHEDELTERETPGNKKSTRSRSRRKATAATDVDTDLDTASNHGAGRLDVEHNSDEGDAEAEEETDPATAHDEELERKHAAYRDWSQIEEMFAVFRDKLYKDRLQRLEEEEQSLLANSPTHPEYLNMKQCLDDRLQQKLSSFDKELDYRTKAHERKSVAQRAQIWGQYFQAVREKRERVLEALNQEWYDVQTARRSAHSLEGYGLLFPKDPAQRIKNAVAYSSEVSALASIAKYEGFPAGPEMKGASPSEMEDDLAAIERSRRGQQKPTVQTREEFHPTSFARLGPAGEQFLKETPWANPNHMAHKIYPQPQPEQAFGRGAQQAPAAGVFREAKPGPETASAKQRSPALSNRHSESPELSRSMLNPAHHQMKRVGSLSSVNRGSKTAAA